MIWLNMKFRQSLFRDTNPGFIDTRKHAVYIIETGYLNLATTKKYAGYGTLRTGADKKGDQKFTFLSPKTKKFMEAPFKR